MEHIEPKSPLGVLKMFGDAFFGEENLWDGARFILADVPVDKEEAQKILPRGLRLDGPPTATLFISNYTKTSFTEPYKEAAVLLHVRSAIGKGVHCPWMIVDDDTALIHGRELLGFPKKMGEFTFDEKGDAIKASITRRGVTVLELEGKRGEEQRDPEPVLGRNIFNSGGPGQMYLFNPLWVFRPTEVIHESYSSKVKVTVRDSDLDPISKLFSNGTVDGRIAVLDIPGGKYYFPLGLGGLMHTGRTFLMRFK